MDREGMLGFTRRMTLSRTPFIRIAGRYVDRDGSFGGNFNTNFLKLLASERTKKLKLTKGIPFAATDVNPKKYGYAQSTRRPGSMWQLLMIISECGLKNDALIDTFYDVVMEYCRADREYVILAFHGRYDIPAKGSNRERQWESEKIFGYMTCTVCPLSEEYEPDKFVCGFPFPALAGRSGDLSHIDAFQADTDRPHNEILKLLRIN